LTTLRRTTTDDPAFRALVSELDADLWQRYGAENEQYADHNAVPAIDTAIVATAGELAIGCGCFRPHHERAVASLTNVGHAAPEAVRRTIELKRMFVVRAARGKGVGAAIVAGLEAWARELGFTDAILETGLGQPEAVALYRKCGYTTIPNYPPYDRLPNSTCMTKRLT
jgi:GNAT superfamily N-acetyltransferase